MSRFDKKLFLAVALLSALQCGTCVNEAVFRQIKGKYLPKSAFKTLKTKNALDCGNYCSRHQYCASVNYKTSGKDQGLCELNSERIKEVDSGSNNAEFNYLEIVKRVRYDIYEICLNMMLFDLLVIYARAFNVGTRGCCIRLTIIQERHLLELSCYGL